MAQPAYITRLASMLPHRPVGNEEMESVLGIVGARPSRARRVILRQNGIVQRHYVIDPESGKPGFNNAQLTAAAVRGLCGDGFALDDLGCLVTGTSIPDQLLPNHGVMVHGELGSPVCEVVATSGVCLSGTTALKYAWLAVASGEQANAVATGSEVASLLMRSQRFAPEVERQDELLEAHPELAFEKDFLRWMLSDAAGAALVQPQPRRDGLSLRIDWIDLFSFAHELPACMYAGAEKDEDGRLRGWLTYSHEDLGARSVMALKQDVRLLNANVVEYCLIKPMQILLKRRALEAERIDWFLPHMSSQYFAGPLAAGLERAGLPIPRERWFTNLAERGNVGSAAMFVMLDDLMDSGRLKRGQHVLCFVPESGRFSSGLVHLTAV